MLLIEKARLALMREAINKDNTLSKNQHNVARFESLCGVFRQQGCSFDASLVVDEDAVQYHIRPHHPGDYLAILESTSLMEARRTPSPHAELFGFDLIDPSPDAPAFWLYTLTSADVHTEEHQQ